MQAFNNRGWTYTNIHRYDDALADLNRAIAMDPTYVQAYYNRAHTYLSLKRLDDALADFVKTVELDPENPVAYRNVGLLLAERGSLREGLPYLQKAGNLAERDHG